MAAWGLAQAGVVMIPGRALSKKAERNPSLVGGGRGGRVEKNSRFFHFKLVDEAGLGLTAGAVRRGVPLRVAALARKRRAFGVGL